jgi:hypothetical protein
LWMYLVSTSCWCSTYCSDFYVNTGGHNAGTIIASWIDIGSGFYACSCTDPGPRTNGCPGTFTSSNDAPTLSNHNNPYCYYSSHSRFYTTITSCTVCVFRESSHPTGGSATINPQQKLV